MHFGCCGSCSSFLLLLYSNASACIGSLFLFLVVLLLLSCSSLSLDYFCSIWPAGEEFFGALHTSNSEGFLGFKV